MGSEPSESPNWPYITHLANCRNRNSPIDSSDESSILLIIFFTLVYHWSAKLVITETYHPLRIEENIALRPATTVWGTRSGQIGGQIGNFQESANCHLIPQTCSRKILGVFIM